MQWKPEDLKRISHQGKKTRKHYEITMLHDVLENQPLLTPIQTQQYVLYRRRWFMLFVVVMFNISNAMIWITFSPVTNYSASYFHQSETKINLFSLVFFIAFVPCCGVAWWIIENRGFRFSVILGTILNALGGGIRVAGVYLCHQPQNKFRVVLIGQVLSACTQPLVLSMPTKIAALWFGDNERTVANTIASVANPVGVMIANGLAAGLVTKSSDIKLLLAVMSGPGILAALFAIFGFTSSEPPTPPSASAVIKPTSFFTGIKEVLCNKQFLLLLLTSGTGISSFSFITTVLQQIICVKGYDNVLAGVAGGLIIGGGLIGSTITGIYIDKTRNYSNTAKVLSMVMGIASAAIIVTSNVRDQPVLLVLSFVLYGFCGLGGLPVFLELGVECTFPVDEATSSGMQWMVGQALGAIMMAGGLAAAPQLTPEEIKLSKCVVEGQQDSHPVNLTYPVLVVFCYCFIPSTIFIFFFNPTYRRLMAEKDLNEPDEDPNQE